MNKINLYSTVTEILDKKNSWNNHNINLYSTLTETFDKKNSWNNRNMLSLWKLMIKNVKPSWNKPKLVLSLNSQFFSSMFSSQDTFSIFFLVLRWKAAQAYIVSMEEKKKLEMIKSLMDYLDFFETGDDFFLVKASNSLSCCFLRYLCAVAVTIWPKKSKSISHTTPFHTDANERSHFLTWEPTKQSFNNATNVICLIQEKQESLTLISEVTGGEATKYFSFIKRSLAAIAGNAVAKPGTKLNIYISSFSIQSRSWLLHTHMMKTVCKTARVWDQS